MSLNKIFSISLFFASSFSLANSKKCVPEYIFKKEESFAQQSVNMNKLIELSSWPSQEKLPIYSILISKQGKLIYEMYTSNIKDNEIHAVYSLTKSVVSLLVGIAKDQGYVKSVNEPLLSIVPTGQIDAEKTKKFSKVTLKDAMGMSAISSEEYPISKSLTAQKNSATFYVSMNRFKHALDEPLVMQVGKDFNYSENTMALIGGSLHSATQKSLSTYASENLFDKLGFRGAQWLYRDLAGQDMAGFGLKMRPVDMHKLGVLVLNKGCWEGEQIISEDWIDQIQKPWMKSNPEKKEPDYGWLWWHYNFKNNWDAFVARGKGEQHLMVFPKKQIVVTMTGFMDGSYPKGKAITKLVNDYIIPAFEGDISKNKPEDNINLVKAIKEANESNKNFRTLAEPENQPSAP